MKKSMITLLIILLTIGFASVSATLVLNGKTSVAYDKNNLQVIFTRVRLNNEESENIIISEDSKSFVYIADDLTLDNNTATIEYDIKNGSSNYDASVVVSCTTDYEDNIEYTGNTLNQIVEIPADEGYTDTLTTTLINTNTNSIAMKCSLIVNPTSRDTIMLGKEYNLTFDSNGGSTIDSSSIVKYYEKYGELPIPTKEGYVFLGWYTELGEKIDSTSLVKVKDNHTLIAKWKEKQLLALPENVTLTEDKNGDGVADIGDKINVGTENFFIISHTTTELNALAEYNLNVGKNPVPSATYGIQNELAKGSISSGGIYGIVAFSKATGWTDATIRSETYRVGAGVASSTMTALDALYSSNASAGIKGYEEYIQGILPDTNASVRLITKSEIEALINDGNELSSGLIKDQADSKEYQWLYSTSYWTQSAKSDNASKVWIIYSSGNLGTYNFDYFFNYGVRPVITISN